MDNFYYLISSLPELSIDWKAGDSSATSNLLEEIHENCSDKDNETIDFFLKGFDADSLNSEFYREALNHSNRFLREYYKFDLGVRNAKTRYLNKCLSREKNTDTIELKTDPFEKEAETNAILALQDMVEREKGLDDLTWEEINELTTFNYFDLDAVLGFIAKLHIINRWIKLDEEEGRKRFRILVEEIRGESKEKLQNYKI